ncbi:MAG: SMP-30/gluconolactonase/LRE family protein [Solobacterium sp.]|nr:SMP-30/gluconolactonase/LRE family protein [Solobacterium sp.]
MEKLTYREGDRGFPIPENEKSIPAVTAEYFCSVPMDGVVPGLNILEGLCFDREGNLFVCNTPMGRIYKIDMQTKEIRLFLERPGYYPSAIKIHKDGRLFVTTAGSPEGGLIMTVSPEGKILDEIVKVGERMIDDMVFTAEGGFYFTDLGGTLAHPSAGIGYVEPNEKTIHDVVKDGMIASNGIALTPDGKHLWVTEYGAGRLHYLGLDDQHEIAACESNIPYYFTGMEGPDSCCIDADGNLYVAMCGQGRFLIFNPHGFPIGQILIPGREEGKMLKSTHPALRPGTDEIYLCTADLKTGESAIFRARGYAETYKSFQFQ